MGTNVTTAFITCPQNPQETLGIKLPFLVMIIKNVMPYLFSSRNILHSKFKFLMIKMYEEDSEHQTINQRQESSHSYVLCLWDWIKDGIKFNSIFPTLREEPMEVTILKPFESLFMLIAESEEYISQIDFIVNKSFLQNSSCFYPFKNNNEIPVSIDLYNQYIYLTNIFEL